MSSEQIKRVWRLDELAAHVAHVLSVLELAQPSGRVRDVPDRRTIRYYTTLGIVSKPSGFQGRVALYGWGHIVQLVAIKRLQMKGQSLSQIQEALLGQPPEAIEALAAIPGELQEEVLAEGQPEATATEATPEVRSGAPKRRSFWKQAPVSSVPAQPEEEGRARGEPGLGGPAQGGDAMIPGISTGVSLAEGLHLWLAQPARGLEEDDVEAIRVAAGPLLKVLQARNLLKARDEGEDR